MNSCLGSSPHPSSGPGLTANLVSHLFVLSSYFISHINKGPGLLSFALNFNQGHPWSFTRLISCNITCNTIFITFIIFAI